jgi:hypothetical protein
MNWALIGIILAVAFFITSVILAIRLARRRKPVWAYVTKKIIGLGTNAPSELKLTFGGIPVNDVYQTNFIFFNSGNEAIRKDDVTEKVTLQFKGAGILRQPAIKQKSSEAIRFTAKQVVKNAENSVELDFLYLDHKDGAVVEVMHTECKEITCEANIIGAGKPRYIGTLDQIRARHSPSRLLLLISPLLFAGVMIGGLYLTGRGLLDGGLLWYVIAMFASIYVFNVPTLVRFYRYLRFPKWSTIPEG